MRAQHLLRQFRYTLLVAAIVSWPAVAGGQVVSGRGGGGVGATAGDGQYELRTYDVSDLILDIQDHPYSEALQQRALSRGGSTGGGMGGGGGGGGGGMFSVPDDAGANDSADAGKWPLRRSERDRNGGAIFRFAQFGGGGRGSMVPGNTPEAGSSANITIDDLCRVIVTMVAADTWADTGGGEGRIEPLGTALVVWQTVAVHRSIDELLSQVRAAAADRRTVTIDARWLLLASDDLGRLLVAGASGVPVVDRGVLDEFTRRPGTIRGITNCFSSQLVYLVSGTRQNVVSGYVPVVGSLDPPASAGRLASADRDPMFRFVADGSETPPRREPDVGYQPLIETPNLGALLEIRPTLVAGDGAVVVDLKSTITVPGSRPVGPMGSGASAGLVPEVDRIAIETQEFATTLRMPLAKPVLVGGLTYVPAAAGMHGQRQLAGHDGEATAETPQLYLVLEVR